MKQNVWSPQPRENVWSPQPREKYTVTLKDGVIAGLGARSAFDHSPGLWNLFWLHSITVDTLLDWEGDPAEAPCYSEALNKCMESLFCVCGFATMEHLAVTVTAEQFIKHLMLHDCHPPIRVWLDEPEEDSWFDFVVEKAEKAKGFVKMEGNLAHVNF